MPGRVIQEGLILSSACVLGNTLGSEGKIEKVNFQYTIFENYILTLTGLDCTILGCTELYCTALKYTVSVLG